MLRSLKGMLGYGIEATDGRLGRVHDFLFEDDTWEVRYLVDDTGNWLPGRKVILPVSVLESPDWRNELFVVPHTQDEIRNAPGVPSKGAVTREAETSLFEHFQWIPYWAPHGLVAPVAAQPASTEPGGAAVSQAASHHHSPGTQTSQDSESHLQGFNDCLSLHVEHAGDDLGRVTDFVFDDQHWQIVSVVFDTGHWLRGKRIQIPVERVRGVFPEHGRIKVEMSKAETETCPAFNQMKLMQDQLQPESEPRDLRTGDTAK